MKDKIETAFDFKTGKWNISWPGRISKHDLVYNSVFNDPMRGIPLGNGDVGVLCWCQESRVIFVINKCDLWQDSYKTDLSMWSDKESESNTTLCHGARIIIDFQKPVFDPIYLSGFTGRLSLADAKMSINLDGPFGKLSIDGFVDKACGVLFGKINSNFNEQNQIILTLERFGSRTFFYWYRMFSKDSSKGLSGTESITEKDGVFLTHELSTGRFAVALKTNNYYQCKSETRRLHSNAAQIRVLPEGKCSFQFQSAVTSPVKKCNPLKQLEDLSAPAYDPVKAFRKHKSLWKKFWLRSMMDFGNDYLDNLWYLNMYYANCSQGGKYPGRFINGLWHWNRDIQPWNFYYHWNQQQIYWPLNAAGHHDLVKSYLDFRYSHLNQARDAAGEFFKVDGAFVADTCDRKGYNAVNPENHTPVAEIALDFWRQYEFTQDLDFLKRSALPYMLEASKFMISRFKKGIDGKYHAKPGTGYEGWLLLKDCITELSLGRSLFKATLDAIGLIGIDTPFSQVICKVLDGMTDFKTVADNKGMIKKSREKYVYNLGPHKGKVADGNRLLSVGIPFRNKKSGTRPISGLLPYNEASALAGMDIYDILQKIESGWEPSIVDGRETVYIEGIFPVCEGSVVFPSNQIGIDDKNSDLYKAAVNTFRIWGKEFWGGEPFPTILARLGLAEELQVCLQEYPRRWQWYPNGWGHYGISQRKIESSVRHSMFVDVWDTELDPEDRVKPDNTMEMPRAPFRHMGFEGMSNLSCAMNEALLQSHNGVIRIVPAIHKKQDARFTLHARGGFTVSGQSDKGKLKWAHIKSKSANHCVVQNPWSQCSLFCDGNYLKSISSKRIVLDFNTNQQLILLPGIQKKVNFNLIKESNKTNESRKIGPSGLEFLGL